LRSASIRAASHQNQFGADAQDGIQSFLGFAAVVQLKVSTTRL